VGSTPAYHSIQEPQADMEKAELLSTFNGHLDAYAKLRSFIDKAQAQADSGKFSSATIEKVVLRNEIKSSEIADDIRPLVDDLQAVVADLQAEISATNEKKATADEEMEELELRKIIGELSDEDFEAEASAFKSELDAAEGRLAGLQEELEAFSGAVDRWVDLAVGAGHETGVADDEPVAEDEPAEVQVSDDEGGDVEIEVDDEDDDEDGVEVEFEEIEVADGDEGVHAELGGMTEDLSDVFGSEAGAAVKLAPVTDEEEISIEAGEVEGLDEDAEAVDVDFGYEGDDDEEAEEVDILADEVDEVEIDLVGGEEDEGEDDLGLDDVPSDAAVEGDDGAGDRRALLIYQEGTAEEQIYPFTGDVLTIGRGRDNDIQIKNDSKVSRYHCKVFRRGDNFYIEDNKSSNGSLVNGELITERRLFGGEEVIIGETFFRFRIMD
jgi:hypothetical protein